MIKIFSSQQVRSADSYTILNEPISSTGLMERAGNACVTWLNSFRNIKNSTILIFCGPGNNGGDGLVIARLLHEQNIDVKAFIPGKSITKSEDFEANLQKAVKSGVCLLALNSINEISSDKEVILIDALFGSGLSKPIEGIYKEIVAMINSNPAVTIAIDIPSGLYADKPVDFNNIACVKADYTLSFQFPKQAFLFPENEFICGDWHILPIGLHPGFIQSEPCKNYLTEFSDIKSILKPRSRFSHKGTFGHSLLIGGSKGKAGAAVLMSQACIRSGSGLVTAHIPGCGYQVLQTAVPEAMVSEDENPEVCTRFPSLDGFTAIAAGPGLGTNPLTASMLKHLIQEIRVPLLLDADALNILADNRTWLAFLPKGTVLTPHPGEFARLAGRTSNSFDRLLLLREMSIKYSLNIVLKGAYTVVCSPLGNCYFNPSGNPGMATGGSGDILTGLITGLLAQGYNATEACIAGVYLHGRAGDIAAQQLGFEALAAGDIIQNFGNAFKELYQDLS